MAETIARRCFECHTERDTHYFDLWDEWLCPNHAMQKLHRHAVTPLLERVELLEAVVRDVATGNPVAYEERGARCTLCDGEYTRLNDGKFGVGHRDTCPWVRAVTVVAQGTEA